MRKQPFTCPSCRQKQPFKQMLRLSNNSTWRCIRCNAMLKPKSMSPYSGAVGFAASGIPGYLCFRLGCPFAQGMLVASLGGIIGVLGVACYYYFLASELEEV